MKFYCIEMDNELFSCGRLVGRATLFKRRDRLVPVGAKIQAGGYRVKL